MNSSYLLETKTKNVRAVFLDRDGVINAAFEKSGKPYPPATLAEFELLPGVAEACVQLKTAGFLLVVITNQPDVGRGDMLRSDVELIHKFMCRVLPIDRVEVCYHSGNERPACECRKPLPGMLFRAAKKLSIDLSQSWMVGDRWRDINCGAAAGCRTVFINHGYQEELGRAPDFRTNSLLSAAQLVIANSQATLKNS